ncbi:MAG: hypothetical protein L6R40_006026 [Gallowayella cf. fulva]|nr:MAG: hypothetical protein L6R40_006026 [Xanthomendoza cf. fulva]
MSRNLAKSRSKGAEREKSTKTIIPDSQSTATTTATGQSTGTASKLDHETKAMPKPAEREKSCNTVVPDSQPPTASTGQSTGSAVSLDHDIKVLLDGQRADINRITANIALLDGQRADLDRIVLNLDSLMQDVKTMKDSMDYLKFQQKTLAEHETAPSPIALAEDIQALTESVARVKDKAAEVDAFKRELGSLKERIQYLEDLNASRPRTVDASAQATIPTSRPGTQRQSNLHDQPGPDNVLRRAQTNPPPTLLGAPSAQASARRKTSTYSLPPETIGNEDGRNYQNGEQLYAMSSALEDDMTPENDPIGSVEPHITSAEKVAAQNRRRLSYTSSDSGPPSKRRGRPPINKRKPDRTTKPISLNDYNNMLASDPEDDDYDPDQRTQELEDVLANERPSRPYNISLVRMPTPEWEKPDWEGPSIAVPVNSTRGKSTIRRGVSGRGPLFDREVLPRRSSGNGNADYVYFDSPQYWEDERPNHPTPDAFEKPRDAQGRLLRPNGKIDGRSLRHQRAREEKERQAAVQRQLRAWQQEPTDMTKGQHKDTQTVGLTASGPGRNFVDAAALQAAGYAHVAANGSTATAAGATNQPSVAPAIKIEANGKDANGAVGTVPAVAGVAAPPLPGDKHAGLMKQVFPWR